MAKARPIRRLMVNTNGLRIAQDEEFVKRLAGMEGFEIYLQFDSFEREVLLNLRGRDLRLKTIKIFLGVLDNFFAYGIGWVYLSSVAKQ